MGFALDHTVADLVAGDLVADGMLGDLLGAVGIGEAADPGRVPRIRSILVALAARAAGAARVDPDAQVVAEVLDLLLVAHDVALGRRGGRRRRVARRVLRRVGANALTLRALEVSRHASHPEILGEVIDTLREIADGQAIAADLRRGVPLNEALWREHADGHAGAVFAFCCRAGGHLGGGDTATVGALSRYGRHVGRLWYGAEDLAAVGRGVGADHVYGRAVAGRPPLPVVCAAAREARVAQAWSALVCDPQPNAAGDVLALAVAVGGVREAREVVAREAWAAQRALGVVAPSPYRRGMERLAVGLARAEAA